MDPQRAWDLKFDVGYLLEEREKAKQAKETDGARYSAGPKKSAEENEFSMQLLK